MPRQRLRDVVIVLPGITGSVLQKDGTDLWAISGRAAWRALTDLGSALDDLRLVDDDPDREVLDDGIRAVGIMPDVHLVPGLVKIDGYSTLRRLITDNFSVVPGAVDQPRPANFFEFPYDWRRDNRVAARRLDRLVATALPRWKEYSGSADAEVVLLAHSMGGLVARYWLEVMEGWRACRALVTFGTPHRGSVDVLGFLVNGYKKLFVDLTEVMRSFTSCAQLLPIWAMLESGGTTRRVAETGGVPGIDHAKAVAGLAFHREIESAVDEHRSDAEYLRDGYRLIPIVGTRQPTYQSARLHDGEVTVHRDVPEWIDPLLADGDGTVPRLSAIPIELSSEYRETFVAERHSSLQANATVLDDLRERITAMQVPNLAAIRGAAVSRDHGSRPAIALDVDDLYVAAEEVEVRAAVVNADDDFGGIVAEITPCRAGAMSVAHPMRRSDAGWTLRAPPEPGIHRIEVRTERRSPDAPAPVHDVFEIMG